MEGKEGKGDGFGAPGKRRTVVRAGQPRTRGRGGRLSPDGRAVCAPPPLHLDLPLSLSPFIHLLTFAAAKLSAQRPS